MRPAFILLLMIPLNVFSQEQLKFSQIVDVSGVDKNELFMRGREWFNEHFKSSKADLQIVDKVSGELAGKGVMDVAYSFKYLGERNCTAEVSYQMNVWVKEGKYKYEMTNFIILGTNGNINFGLITTSDVTTKAYIGLSQKKINEMYLSIKQGTEKKAKQLIEVLKQKMSMASKYL